MQECDVTCSENRFQWKQGFCVLWKYVRLNKQQTAKFPFYIVRPQALDHNKEDRVAQNT